MMRKFYIFSSVLVFMLSLLSVQASAQNRCEKRSMAGIGFAQSERNAMRNAREAWVSGVRKMYGRGYRFADRRVEESMDCNRTNRGGQRARARQKRGVDINIVGDRGSRWICAISARPCRRRLVDADPVGDMGEKVPDSLSWKRTQRRLGRHGYEYVDIAAFKACRDGEQFEVPVKNGQIRINQRKNLAECPYGRKTPGGDVLDDVDDDYGHEAGLTSTKWVASFGASAGGWSSHAHIRTMADVNGDGKKDVVGFGQNGVYVALARRNRFSKPAKWSSGFSRRAGWSVVQNPRMMADVNGDGRADIVGFGNDGVYVALARRNRFTAPARWVIGFGAQNGGWSGRRHLRTVADVNGDGRADIVGFGNDGVYVSIARRNRFSPPEKWVNFYGPQTGGWSIAHHPRMMADVNGDGRADVVGFSDRGVYVSLALQGRFSKPKMWVAGFGRRQGAWSVAQHPRMMADVNGDGKADIVGFGNGGIYVSLAQRGRFSPLKLWLASFGARAGGWSVTRHLRMMADVNGDGKADIVGFGNDGVHIALAGRGRFAKSKLMISAYGVRKGSWSVVQHPRIMADVNGDRKADIVGFANDGVYVTVME